MKNLYVLLVAGLVSVFFMSGPTFAVENRQPQKECDPVTQESVLKKGIEESPELVMAIIEGEDLNTFFERMRKQNMIVGSVGVDKIYIFYSENHPHWVYVYFLDQGCILDVKFTFKNLIEFFITGNEDLIRRPNQ